ncbi:hypothetical protein SAPIO_CDS7174 [Scedosporium apiospermum]|uniref:Uncharacterized protein n=1 Tax=Pseudallescheria apiosperma TaxID=563466 RepID=A0A084G198_PSEDA|nr:uncharacterized protein SAPIO_CDS7174 [Scedosporium apiospermum]KEZ41110.1 hypothetical protein SAPIO_CDS7174 [Scedosporium apiospermum]
MAQHVPHQAKDKRRVKVYELRNNDWFDRGTGFCTAAFTQSDDGQCRDARVIVESEDEPDRLLLDTSICREDGFQKQRDTLIVWTEPNSGLDMALSFQEPEGCAMIWKFVNSVQQSTQNGLGAADDNLSDDLTMDLATTVSLPPVELGNLSEIETKIRIVSSTGAGRDALAKYILKEDYIRKMIPLVETSEDFESLPDLHRLCNIMKTVILLNDPALIEHVVSDECVDAVVGALEYDPDFPNHKANHRAWLNGQGRFKEVVPIEDEHIRHKIHQTYRLQYLKDVVLARILDDPTFSVLNSLIFFNQVEIVQHLQGNAIFLNELFGIFKSPNQDPKQKKDAVLFIQQCCTIAKNLQPPARQALYNNFLAHGLLQIINFGLRHPDVGASMFSYLIEILCFFIRQHYHRSKSFVLQRKISLRILQLLQTEEKYLKLVAIRFFRQLLGLQDVFYVKHLIDTDVFGPILDILIGVMPRDNLLGSACIEFFEFIKKESMKDLVKHLVQNYRPQLVTLSSLETFRDMIIRYDQTQGFTTGSDFLLDAEEDVTRRPPAHARMMEQLQVDPTEEAYWNEDDEEEQQPTVNAQAKAPIANGTSPSTRLVDYLSDGDEEEMEEGDAASGAVSADAATPSTSIIKDGELALVNDAEAATKKQDASVDGPDKMAVATDDLADVDGVSDAGSVVSEAVSDTSTTSAPPQKRRREEDDDDDELGKLMQNKRRNSKSMSTNSSTQSILKRKQSFTNSTSGSPKISISISSTGAGLRSSSEDS